LLLGIHNIKFYNYPAVNKKSVMANSISFAGTKTSKRTKDEILVENPALLNNDVLRQKIARKRISMLKPIQDEQEYKEVFKKNIGYLLYDLTSENKYSHEKVILDRVNDIFGFEKVHIKDLEYINFDGYENIDFNLKGVVPYCGFGDISRQINSWITARYDLNPTLLNDEQMADIIRAMEYSLKMLDKKYGKYEGYVYRAGYFNPLTDKQYYSTSYYPSGAVEHVHRLTPSKTCPYSIIRLKKGHDIYQFQKDTATETSMLFAFSEREILINRKSKFKIVPKTEYTSSEKYDIKNIIFQTTDKDIKDIPVNVRRDMTDNITVWEEI